MTEQRYDVSNAVTKNDGPKIRKKLLKKLWIGVGHLMIESRLGRIAHKRYKIEYGNI